MHILLFILYAIAGSYAVSRMPIGRQSGLKPAWLIGYFIIRVAAGCAHNYIALKYYPNQGDIWQFFRDSFTTRKLLYQSFSAFWADNSRLADGPHNLIEWLHLILNYFSFDNLYINTLLFNLITFGGFIALFQVVYKHTQRNLLAGLSILLLPSTLFWTSCIHTEGIVFALLGWLIYYFDKGLIHGWRPRIALLCLLSGGLAIFMRPALGVGLLPGLAIWTLGYGTPSSKAALCAALLFSIAIAAAANPLMAMLAKRQSEFMTLTGNSRIPLPTLTPDAASFIKVFPYALCNGYFQPFPGKGGQAIYTAFASELIVVWLIVLAGLASNAFKRRRLSPLAWCSIVFALLGMLLIGYIVPFIGAIVRYRSLYLPFLLWPFIPRLPENFAPASLPPTTIPPIPIT